MKRPFVLAVFGRRSAKDSCSTLSIDRLLGRARAHSLPYMHGELLPGRMAPVRSHSDKRVMLLEPLMAHW
jgi:hypothetical protein